MKHISIGMCSLVFILACTVGGFYAARCDLHWLGSVQRLQELPLLPALRQRGR